MAVHRLVLDDAFDDAVFALMAIHCRLEDYRLAYLLNKYLGARLARRASDIDVNDGKTAYSIFEWDDERQMTTWSLVSNICKAEEVQKSNFGSLFNNHEKITKTYYLLPEHKTVNYFLKIDGEFSFNKEKYILDRILSIPQIATTYSIDYSKLKSKDNLIFN